MNEHKNKHYVGERAGQPPARERTTHDDHIRPYTRRDVRSLAFHLIYALDRLDYQESLDTVVDDFKQTFHIDVQAYSFAIELARGTLQHREYLDSLIAAYLKNWRIERLGCCTLLILRIALWELFQKDAIAQVVINEAVELAKSFAEKDAYKFINGVLDAISKSDTLKNHVLQKKE